MSNRNNMHALVRNRDQYRQALTAQLRDGLAANRNIDLRDRGAALDVVVTFSDEAICPVWESLAATDRRQAHLFVAPTEFTTGRLSMVSACDGRPDVSDVTRWLDSDATFEDLVRVLRAEMNGVRIGLLRAPATIDDSGFAYSFDFANLVDI